MSTIFQLAAACPTLEVLNDNYSLEADNRGYHGNIRFWFQGSDLLNFTTTVGGLAQTLTWTPPGGSTAISYSRLIPLIHPYITGGNCYADNIRVFPPDGSVSFYDGVAIGY